MPDWRPDEIEDIRRSILVLCPDASNMLGREKVLEILDQLLKVTEDRNRLVRELSSLGYA